MTSFTAQLVASNGIRKVMVLKVVYMYMYLYILNVHTCMREWFLLKRSWQRLMWHSPNNAAQSSIYVYVFICIFNMYICEKTTSFEAQLAASNGIRKLMELEVVYMYMYSYLICILVWENDFFWSAVGSVWWHPPKNGAQSPQSGGHIWHYAQHWKGACSLSICSWVVHFHVGGYIV